MGRTGLGVEIRAKSIRLSFMLDGVQERRTLMINGAPVRPTPANVKYAHRVASEIRDKIRHGTFVMAEYFSGENAQDIGTLSAHLDAWLGAQRIATSTRDGYRSACNFWKKAVCDGSGTILGSVQLRAVRLSHLLTAIANRPDLSGKTINNYVTSLREALDLAVRDKVLTDNPTAHIPRAKHQKTPPDPFSREEIDSISSLLSARHPGPIHNLVEFWSWTGLRTSEIFGLRWANVDLASGTILVAETLVKGEHKDTTKTAVARTVRLNSVAKAAIQRQRAHTQIAGGTVFLDPTNGLEWSDERRFRRVYWTPALRQLGIRYRRPYNMRHTYATAMLMAGMTPAFCAKQLGHSIEMFLSTYSKWLDGDQNDLEMSRLESSILPRKLPDATASGFK